MRFGLKNSVIQKLKSFFERYRFINKVMIFGSRARGDYGKSSDIDLCLFSKNMSSREFSKLKFKLDELPILYKIDIVHFEKVDRKLQENIIKVGISIYNPLL